MLFSNRIRLFWWNEKKLQNKSKENYGDLLSKYLVEKISNKTVVWARPSKGLLSNWISPTYLAIGSIIVHAARNSIVWGSGIVSKEDDVKQATFLAVRGPQTRDHLLKLGYTVPEVYGDPAILLPDYYNPSIEKRYGIGIIPHYSDYELVRGYYSKNSDIHLISLMTNDVEETTNELLKCKRIVSSSLHGVIVAHAYGIPAVWQKFSNNLFGDDIKYKDYFESVGIKPYDSDIKTQPLTKSEIDTLFEEKSSLPDMEQIHKLSKGLMKACPFKPDYIE
ncbi:MAG: polysaccharide pyruvyl transferase family protein [Winogradskyella sp.]|nr:polysaccharide pyruvyl transferase family protein [Winogradskyella sp.]